MATTKKTTSTAVAVKKNTSTAVVNIQDMLRKQAEANASRVEPGSGKSIRIGQDKGRNKSAVKVWDQRAYKDYDDTKELGTRNIKVALRRLRRFAREGAEL